MELGITSLFKKKVSEEKVAELFVNIVFNSVDSSFEDVAELINNDLNLVERPSISPDDMDDFLMVIIAGNYHLLDNYFHQDGQEDRIRHMIVKRLAKVYEISEEQMRQNIERMLSYFQKINFPSKNIHYAMSKAVFFKYDLAKFQKDYFKNLGSPDPIFLKHLDEIVDQFVIRWDTFTDKYKIAE